MSQQLRIRRLVLTGAVTAITATGAWYGAGLKTQQEVKKVSLPFPVLFLYLRPSKSQARSPRVRLTADSMFDTNCRKSKPNAKPRQRRRLRNWKRCVGHWWRRESDWRGRFRDCKLGREGWVGMKGQREGSEGEGSLLKGRVEAYRLELEVGAVIGSGLHICANGWNV